MKRTDKLITIFLLPAYLCLLLSCKKDFLDTKPNKALLVPETLADLRALLDNAQVFNQSPALFNNADGDTWVNDAGFNGYFLEQERGSYTWAADIFGTEAAGDWNVPYQQVFYANIVLEGLDKLPADTAGAAERNAVRGTALFHRAFALYNLAQEFTLPYNPGTANTDPGIPIRLNSDVNEKVGRGSVAGTYRQILQDLLKARMFLPATVNYKTRPGTAAAFAMLARVYLSMSDYGHAGSYADSCLQLSPALLNYNSYSTTATRPFPRALPNSNNEVLFYSTALSYTFTGSASPTVADSLLYRSYADNDLRKVLFFRTLSPGFKFKGNYAGIIAYFSGIATDEMYLTRAECLAREGKKDAAMAGLNTLLSTRWRPGTYVPYSAATADEALALILNERRKELTARGTRWADLRRLNSDARFAVMLTRKVRGNTYTLEPGSKRYAYPIPKEEVQLSGIAQNER
ncbi:RagB/SusD family nutrient uptake outer membrane protein [Mucilaginibacter pedocola]|uniref:Carbohydrate-binding protein SusD n=1 Tax=Mucilaginibacter pedocola TaxID=1792845 RepID=A0A1S9PG99_9SPHI|nr:RagB/SusD family nutrient uptake outer membrane protein [Mucilaginibacter pedocola]OOQ59994.1 hypothetical protein BC343_27065 [Mucilaginibacter pedocola]